MNSFNVLLNKIEGYTKYVYFHIMGEPLLHPHINELIDKASERFNVNITSNGYLIDRVKDNKNIRQINISLHSYDKKYGKSLDEYLDNIFTSTDILNKKGTIINYRLWVDGVNKLDIINRLEDKYNVKIGNKNKVKLGDNIFYEIEDEFIWPSLDNDYYNESCSCMGTRDHIGILVDGTVVPCCLDSDGLIDLGNVYKQELNDIINGDLFQEIRNGFLSNKKKHELCKKCNFYEMRK
jgi:radical SAM protein with 4Fe4S-binding SPASM domain